jgi:hypothetical protein
MTPIGASEAEQFFQRPFERFYFAARVKRLRRAWRFRQVEPRANARSKPIALDVVRGRGDVV